MKQSCAHLILELIWDYLDPLVLHNLEADLPNRFHYKMYRNLTIVAVLDEFEEAFNSSDRESSCTSSSDQSSAKFTKSGIRGSFYLSFIDDEILHREVKLKDIQHYFKVHGSHLCQLKVTVNGYHMRYTVIEFMSNLWEWASQYCTAIPVITCHCFIEGDNTYIASAQSLELTVDPTQTFELPIMKCTRFGLNKEFNDIMGMEKQLINIIPKLENVRNLNLGSEEPLMFWDSNAYLEFHGLLNMLKHLKELTLSVALYNLNVALDLQKIKINKLKIAIKVEDEPTKGVGLINIMSGFDTRNVDIEASTLILRMIPILNSQNWDDLKFQNLDKNEIAHLDRLDSLILKFSYFSWMPIVPVIPKNCKYCCVSLLVMIPDDPTIEGYNLDISRTFENVYEYIYIKIE